MTHPYSDLGGTAFWRSGVAEADPAAPVDLYRPKFALGRDAAIGVDFIVFFAVHGDVAVGDHLASSTARRREAEAVDDVVETHLEEAVEGLRRRLSVRRGSGSDVVAELLLGEAVGHADLLLFKKLATELSLLRTATTLLVALCALLSEGKLL